MLRTTSPSTMKLRATRGNWTAIWNITGACNIQRKKLPPDFNIIIKNDIIVQALGISVIASLKQFLENRKASHANNKVGKLMTQT